MKHEVTFYSPRTLTAETTTVIIDVWDVEEAVQIALNTEERHCAIPYGFQFYTKNDGKIVDSSPMYYLGGEVETLKEIENRRDPKDAILIQNMKTNKWNRVLTNTNSWKWTQPLNDKDVVLDVNMSRSFIS